jgi:hypothetical protein
VPSAVHATVSADDTVPSATIGFGGRPHVPVLDQRTEANESKSASLSSGGKGMAMHASDSVKKKTHTVTDGHFRLITEKEYTVLSIFLKKKSGKASFCEKKLK